MLKYLGKRVGLMLLTIISIIIIVFFLLRLMPGYPTAVQAKLESLKPGESKETILASYGITDNSFKAFGDYIKGIFTGDFGVYYKDTSITITKLFLEPIKYTLAVTGPAFIMGTTFGIIFGFISGYKRGKWQDVTVNIVATFFVAVPSFVLATFLMLFGNKIGLPTDFLIAEETGRFWLGLLLPIIIITITSFSSLTYYIRNEVVEVLTSDYITIARSKGLSETQIFFKHIIRNVSLPFITIVFPSFLYLIFGSLVIEMFFFVPGSSSLFNTAVQNKETYVIMFSTLFFTTFGLLVRILIDVLYAVFDPRIKIGSPIRWSPLLRIEAKKARLEELAKKNANKEVNNGFEK